jgi:hypothetical protein
MITNITDHSTSRWEYCGDTWSPWSSRWPAIAK